MKHIISDMFVLDLKWKDGVLTALTENDHLLRRFGQLDLLHIGPSESKSIWRQEADEIWTLYSGEAEIELIDKRGDSPSFEKRYIIKVSQDFPKAVLIPFGIECTVKSTDGASFLRLSTHNDLTFPRDRTLASL